ncbi:hydroxypyruvate isomerase, partial [Rhizobium ruizarguesonis]
DNAVEATAKHLLGALVRVIHVHVADHPGRNEPGSGSIDLAHRLGWILANGYNGEVGLEYRPTKPGADAVKEAIASLG